MNKYIAHHGILGQKWGVRRYQNKDGSLTSAGREHYGVGKKGTHPTNYASNGALTKIEKARNGSPNRKHYSFKFNRVMVSDTIDAYHKDDVLDVLREMANNLDDNPTFKKYIEPLAKGERYGSAKYYDQLRLEFLADAATDEFLNYAVKHPEMWDQDWRRARAAQDHLRNTNKKLFEEYVNLDSRFETAMDHLYEGDTFYDAIDRLRDSMKK